MGRLILILGVLLSPVTLCAADARPVITREALKYAQAWQRSDFQAIVSFLPPRVVQQSGGRAALVAEFKEKFAQARALGATDLRTTLGPPTVPKQIGRWLASVFPVTAVVQSSHLELTQDSQVLALSADQGKQWFFVLLYEVTQEEMIAWFPEFRGKVFVPTPPSPRMKIVY